MHATEHQPPTVTPAPTPAPTPAQLLRGAADYLTAHGWHQGGLYGTDPDDHYPPACAAGSIYLTADPDAATRGEDHAALHPRPGVPAAVRFFAGYLLDTGRTDQSYDQYADLIAHEGVIGDWNDASAHTAGEVAAALRDAADQWDRHHPTGGRS